MSGDGATKTLTFPTIVQGRSVIQKIKRSIGQMHLKVIAGTGINIDPVKLPRVFDRYERQIMFTIRLPAGCLAYTGNAAARLSGRLSGI